MAAIVDSGGDDAVTLGSEITEGLAKAIFQSEEDLKEEWTFERDANASSTEGCTEVKKGDMIKVHYVGVLRRKEKKPDVVEFCDINDEWSVTRPREDGKVVVRPFDSSRSRNRNAIRFTAGAEPRQVVRGFDECLLTMRLGDKGILTIRSDAAYGEKGCQPRVGAPVDDKGIPGSTDIIFHLELLSVNGEESPVEAAETKRLAVEQEKARQAAEDSFLDGLALPGGGGGNKAPGFPSKKKNKKGNGKKKK